MSLIRNYLRDETGTTAAEYTLILAIICIALVSSGYKLQLGITSKINFVANAISSGPSS